MSNKSLFSKEHFLKKYNSLSDKAKLLCKEVVQIIKFDYGDDGYSYLTDDLFLRYSKELRENMYGAFGKEKAHRSKLRYDEREIFNILIECGVVYADDEVIGRTARELEDSIPPFDIRVEIQSIDKILEMFNVADKNSSNSMSIAPDFALISDDISFGMNIVYCNGENREDGYKKGLYVRDLSMWKRVNIDRNCTYSLIKWLYNQNKGNKFISLQMIALRTLTPLSEVQKVPSGLNKALKGYINDDGNFLEQGKTSSGRNGWRINPDL